MSRKTIAFAFSAAVAQNGTFQVSYPAGFNAGNFKNGKRHRLNAIQANFEAPKDMTLSFGAAAVTVTYKGATTIPAGSQGYLELDMVGSGFPERTGEEGQINRTKLFRTGLIDFGSPIASNDAYFRAAASISGSGSLALLQTSLDVPRNIILASTGNESGITFTVTGKDEYLNTVVETITGPNTTSAGKKAFKTVTSISASGASAGNVKIGFGDVLGLPVFVADPGEVLVEYENNAVLESPPSLVSIPWELNATDLSAGTASQIVSPVKGTLKRLRSIVQVAIVTGGDITMTNASVAVNGLAATIANSATVGTAASATPTAGHATTLVAKGARLEVVPAAAFNGGGAMNGTVEIQTDEMNGTLVVGDTSTPSATTGDVRGTYDPTTACDGTTAFKLLVAVLDPSYRGSPQYAG